MSARLRFRSGLSLVEGSRRDVSTHIASRVARNVRELRRTAGYSLEVLSQKAGVSRAMLGQIETAKSVPTITVLWRIAEALNVEVSALIAASSATPIRPIEAPPEASASHPGVVTRDFSGGLSDARGAVVEVSIEPGGALPLDPNPARTETIIIVAQGQIHLSVDDAEDFVIFERTAAAIQPGSQARLENRGPTPAILHLVRTSRPPSP